MIVRKSEIDFVVNLPLRGEFALRIYKLDEKMEATNVCNYLFTDAGDDHRREVNQALILEQFIKQMLRLHFDSKALSQVSCT